MSDWDAVVVGAGHNGLVAANVLADAGWSVLVLEAAAEPGGACRTGDVTAPGFVTDLFSSFYPLGAVAPALRRLRLDRHGMRWSRAPIALCHVLPDGRTVALSHDIDVTARSVARFDDRDADRWRVMHGQWSTIRGPLLSSLLGPFPPVRAAAQVLRSAGPGGALRLARLGVNDAWRLGDQRFGGEGARLLLLGNAMHADVTASSPGSGVLGWLLAMVGQDVGFPVPIGGSGRIVDALVDRARSRGVEIRCGRAVDEVVVRGGRAVGVHDATGDLHMARRAVLADVTAPHLFLDLVGAAHLPDALVADLDGFGWDHATVKVNWAVGTKVPWTADEPRRAGTVHLGGDAIGLADQAHDLAVGRAPESPFVLVGQTTTADPTRSPSGTESVWAYTHIPRALAHDDAVVDEQVRRIESAIEQHAPGFGGRVLARNVQTPSDLERADRNLDAGSINAGTAALHQQLVLRPSPGLGRPETPIDGLYLAGASAHPGGGVHGAPGWNAARAALRRHHLATRLPALAVQKVARRLAEG